MSAFVTVEDLLFLCLVFYFFHLFPLLYPGGSWKSPIKKNFRPGVFLEFYHQFFLNFGIVLKTHIKLCPKIVPKKWENGSKMDQKEKEFSLGFQHGHQVLLKFFYNENSYHLLCCCTNPIFRKSFPKIWANQIAGFFNQPYLQIKLMKQLGFSTLIQIHINKIFLVGMVQNGSDQSSHRTLKLTVSQEMNRWNKLIFAFWGKFRKTKSYFNYFCVGVTKGGCGHLVHATLKSAVTYE